MTTEYTARSPAGPTIRTDHPLIARQLRRWGYRVSAVTSGDA